MKYPSVDFDAAVAAYCEGTANEDQQRALGEILRENEAARDAYLFAVELHARLATENSLFLPAIPEPVSEEKVVPFPEAEKPARYRRFGGPLAAAALFLTFAMLSALYFAPKPIPAPFARLIKSAGAEFSSEATLAEGAALHGEKFVLAKGSIELATARGATVVLEAPAEFRFESAQRLQVVRGKVAAEVPPPAKGFTIATPSSEVIDLGTKFGVDVGGDGASEVHVFKGEVIAGTNRATPGQSLKQDQALTMAAGNSTPRELRTAAFIHADELQELAAGLRGGRQAHWKTAMEALRNDPALLAFPEIATLPDGEFRRVQGRWPGTQAVEFTRPGDFVPLDFSGTTSELTLAAWVRLDRVPQAINSLLHTNGWGQPGQVHWMVADNQRMRLAVYDVRAAGQTPMRYPESSRAVTAATGRWTHLAASYDANRQIVRFYIDGEFDNEVPLTASVPVVLGPGRLGNWNRQERILSGRLDELVLLRRVLGDAEIRALFDAGNPYAGAAPLHP